MARTVSHESAVRVGVNRTGSSRPPQRVDAGSPSTSRLRINSSASRARSSPDRRRIWQARQRGDRFSRAVWRRSSRASLPARASSNEPGDGTGDGHTADDIQGAAFGTADTSFLLRAERSGSTERGREYTVVDRVTDGSGNASMATAVVRVPHSKRSGGGAVSRGHLLSDRPMAAHAPSVVCRSLQR